jgi:hypothetical protein
MKTTAKVKTPAMGPSIQQIRRFAKAEQTAARNAARFATKQSHEILDRRPDKRPRVRARPGRNQPHIKDVIKFMVTDAKTTTSNQSVGSIVLAKVPRNYHHLIQEVGTSATARLITSSARRASPGRAKSGGVRTTVVPRSIRSQIGRRLVSKLDWNNTDPGQIIVLSKAMRATPEGKRRIVITKEIEGKRFISRAVASAYIRYRQDVMSARSLYLTGKKT